MGGAVLHLLSLVDKMDPDEGSDAVVDQSDPISLDLVNNVALIHVLDVPQQPWPARHVLSSTARCR